MRLESGLKGGVGVCPSWHHDTFVEPVVETLLGDSEVAGQLGVTASFGFAPVAYLAEAVLPMGLGVGVARNTCVVGRHKRSLGLWVEK